MRDDERVVGDEERSQSLVSDKMALMIDRFRNRNEESKEKSRIECLKSTCQCLECKAKREVESRRVKPKTSDREDEPQRPGLVQSSALELNEVLLVPTPRAMTDDRAKVSLSLGGNVRHPGSVVLEGLEREAWSGIVAAPPRALVQRTELVSTITLANNRVKTTVSESKPSKSSQSKDPGKGVEEELRTWRDKFTVEDAKFKSRQGVPTYSAGVFCSGGCLDTLALIRSGFQPQWSTEVDGQRATMFEDLTNRKCLGDTFKNDFEKKSVCVLWTGQPCPDWSSSHQGRRPPGEEGKTGWQFVAQAEKILEVDPHVCVIEMVPNALQVNDGESVVKLMAKLRGRYDLHADIVKTAGHGDATARYRMIIIGFKKATVGEAARDFKFPEYAYDETKYHTARDIAVEDGEVPEAYWRDDKPPMLPWEEPKPLEMHKIARTGPGMGHSELCNLIQSWEGLLNTQTTHNGGGRRPSTLWKRGMPLGRTRLTVPVETVRAASLPADYLKWCQSFNGGNEITDDRHLRECVNMGVPLRTACAINEAIRAVLVRACIPFDSQVDGEIGELSKKIHEQYAMNVEGSERTDSCGELVDRGCKCRTIKVDTGASSTFMFTNIEPYMEDVQPSSAMINVAKKGAPMRANKEGKLRAHVLNMAGYGDVKEVTEFEWSPTTVPELSKELLSLDEPFRYGKFSVLLRQPDYEDGVSELYRAPKPGRPEARVPLSYDWYGNGGWNMHYVPAKAVDSKDMELCANYAKDYQQDRGYNAVQSLQQSLLDSTKENVYHEAMMGDSHVVEVVTRKGDDILRPKEAAHQRDEDLMPDLMDKRIQTKKLHCVEAYTSADREILGNKAGMKQAFKRMSRKDFHERFGHQGTCKNCRICQMVKGLKRKIFTKVDPYRETRVGHTWAMDGITFDARSEQGCLYLVVLRDVASGAFQLLPLFRKTDVIPAFKDWVESMRKNPLYENMPYPVVSVVQTDNEGTWMKDAGDWNDMLDTFDQTLEMRYVCPDAHEKENGYAEAACKVVEHSIKSILLSNNLPKSYWQYCSADACFLLNRFAALSDDVNMPADGDRALPLEMLTRGYYSRAMIRRELSYYVSVGTPALVHDNSIRGSALEPKTRWGVAIGMYREQPIWKCPFTKATFRSKSYSAYRLKEGLNYAQFLKLPMMKSARGLMQIDAEDTGDTVVHLPTEQELEVVTPNIVDETAAITSAYLRTAADNQSKAGGTVRVIHEGKQLQTDRTSGLLYHDENNADVQVQEEGRPILVTAQPETHGGADSDTCSDDEGEIDLTPDVVDETPQEYEQGNTEWKDDWANKDHTHRIKKGKRNRKQTQVFVPPTTTEYTRKGKEDGVKVAKKKTRAKKDKKEEKAEDLLELMDDFTVDLATIPGMASQEDEDKEKLRNWERGVKAGVGITFNQMMKKKPLAKAVPYQLRGLYREWLMSVHGHASSDIPVGSGGKNPKASQCVRVGITFPLPGGKEWTAMLERHNSGSRSARSAEKQEDDRLMEECMHAAFVENYNLCKAFYSELEENKFKHFNKIAKRKKARSDKAVGVGKKQPPKTLGEAFHGPDGQEWMESAEKEFNGLTNKKVLDHDYTLDQLQEAGVPVDRVTGKVKPINLSTVLDLKYTDGVLSRYKTRMALAGHSGNMQRGVHYDKTFSPSPNANSTRLLQALMVYTGWGRVAYDIEQAYLHAPLPPGKYIAIKYPHGFERYDGDGNPLYALMTSNLYGHPAGARMWSKTRDKFIKERFNKTDDDGTVWTCHRTIMDPCLFRFTRQVKGQKQDEAICLIYTDDVDCIGSTEAIRESIFDIISDKWGAKKVDASFVLGVKRELKENAKGEPIQVEMTMKAFVEGMMEAFKDKVVSAGVDYKVDTPFPAKQILTRRDRTQKYAAGLQEEYDKEIKEVLEDGYMRAVGMLLWASRNVYAECNAGVSQLCRVMSCPDRTAFKCAMHMVKWMDDQKERGIQFSAEECHPLYHSESPEQSKTNNTNNTNPIKGNNIIPSIIEKNIPSIREVIPSIRDDASLGEKNTPSVKEVIPSIRDDASIIEKNTHSIIENNPPIHQGAYTASIEEMHRRLAPDDNTRVYSAPHRLLPIEEQETFNPLESSNGAPGTSMKKKKVDSGSAVNYYNSNVKYSGDLLKRRRGVPATGFGTPVAFSDASNDSDPHDGLSQAGFVIQMCSGPIVFSSKKLKHKSPTGSASHCEYMALCACNQAVIWLRQLLHELDFQELLEEPTLVYGDNRQANELCKEDLITSGTQYIYLPYHFNKEVQELGYVDVQDIRTGINIADLMTKPVPAPKIRDLCGAMLGYEWVDYVAAERGFHKEVVPVS